MNHCHPTICFWAEQLSKGQAITYEGDPLLDFGIGNFLDRIAYKQPKSSEQTLKFRKRMAQYEQPVNLINFHSGEAPENKRVEEEFMYKFMQLRPERKPAVDSKLEEANTGTDDESEFDPELEKFADEEMQREMKRLVQGAPGGMPDSEDEDISSMVEDEDGEVSEADD